MQGTVLAAYSSGDEEEKKIRILTDSLEHQLFATIEKSFPDAERYILLDSLAELHYRLGTFGKSLEFAMRALSLSAGMRNDSLQSAAMKKIARAYFSLDDYEKAGEYFRKLWLIAEQKGEPVGMADILNDLGNNYYQWSKFDEAFHYHKKALEVGQECGYNDGIAFALKNIAGIHINRGEYGEALSCLQQSLDFYDLTGNVAGRARAYVSLGTAYEDLQENLKARGLYRAALGIYEKMDDNFGIVNSTLHLGDTYLRDQNYDSALFHFFRAEKLLSVNMHKKLYSIALSNIGEVYNMKGDYDKALGYQEKALEIKKEIGDRKRLVYTYIELGKIWYNKKNYQQSLQMLFEGLKNAKQIAAVNLMKNCYQLISQCYEALNDFPGSLRYYKRYSDLKDSLFTANNNRLMAEMRTKYETAVTEQENLELRSKEQLTGARIKIQNLVIAIVAIILFFALFVARLFHARYRENQRINQELSKKNLEIEKQKAAMLKLNQELHEVNVTKDKFFSIIAHDLRNPFSSLIGLTGLLTEDFDTLSEGEKKEFIRHIRETTENTFRLLQHILDWARSQTGKVQPEPVRFDVLPVIQGVCDVLQSASSGKNITVNIAVNPETNVHADKNMVTTVFLNLLSNAIKFTPSGGTIVIGSSQQEGNTGFVVTDNGIGLSHDDLDKLFRLDQKLQTHGTDNEPGTGLGLILCREFVEKNNGRIWAESEPGKGSSFHFTLPG